MNVLGIRRHGARQQQRELPGVAAVQRQRVERRARDDLPDRGRLGLQHLSLAGDFDGLLNPAQFQLEVEADDLLRFHLDRLRRGRLEPRELRLDHVAPDGQRRHV